MLIIQAVAIYVAATLLSHHAAAHRQDATPDSVYEMVGPHTADLTRYFIYSQKVFNGQWPYIDFEMEYPPGSLLAMMGPGYTVRNEAVLEHGEVGILPALFVQVAVLSCLTTLTLWRLHRGRPDRWAVAIRFAGLSVLMTPIAAFRYDTAPMAATAAAILALVAGSFPICGALIGLGVLMKIYPGALLLIVLIALAVRKRWKPIVHVLIGFAVVTAVPFVLYASKSPSLWRAPLGFMQYHSDRGLQIESTWAGFALLARNYLHVPTRLVAVYGALEIKNSWVPVFLTLQHYLLPLAAAATLLFCTIVAYRLRHREEGQAELASRMFALLLIVMLLLAKVFSTQYIIWLLPFCVSGSRWRVALLIAIALATLAIFPFGLNAYGRMSLTKVICVNVRTLLLIALAAETAVWLWRRTKTDGPL